MRKTPYQASGNATNSTGDSTRNPPAGIHIAAKARQAANAHTHAASRISARQCTSASSRRALVSVGVRASSPRRIGHRRARRVIAMWRERASYRRVPAIVACVLALLGAAGAAVWWGGGEIVEGEVRGRDLVEVPLPSTTDR
ncbi:hypothetical protein ACFU44_23275 [Nocardia rhizosphaerihabitans]|uniref:hypothetical protein n=1 Tax=Nocardia rhizosphaerihabitans TaxID=1691570 RepID=UPI003672E60A